MELDKWDKRFLDAAQMAASWSKDPNAQVGAVLVNDRRAIVAVSYNGFPVKIEDTEERLSNKDLKNEIVIHAEQNAVISAGHESRGGTIYVVGKPICPRCAGTLIQAGIQRVVCTMPKDGTASKWDELGRISIGMFLEAGVQITKVPVA